MVFVPEFFTLLGIVVFLGLSFVSWVLDNDLPRLIKYLFQAAAAVGLVTLLFSPALVNNGLPITNSISPARIWISILYLSSALSSLVGLNVHLIATRRETSRSSVLSGLVTAPAILISTVLVFSYLSTGGQANLEPATILVLAVLALVISFGLSGFLRELSRYLGKAHLKGLLSPSIPTSEPSKPSSALLQPFPSTTGDEGWEIAPQKEEDQT